MVKTASTMLPLGSPAPHFDLEDPAGNRVTYASVRGERATLVMFICNHCPYVIHLKDALADLARTYKERGVGIVAINANDFSKYPDDAPDKMAEDAARHGYVFPYLIDRDQSVAKAYRAACTPDFFLFDAGDRLVYRGQFDASRPGNNKPVTGEDLIRALDAVLAGDAVDSNQLPSLGCNIKWLPGNEPDYFGS